MDWPPRLLEKYVALERLSELRFKMLRRRDGARLLMDWLPLTFDETRLSLFEAGLGFLGEEAHPALLPLHEVIWGERHLALLYNYRPYRLEELVPVCVLSRTQMDHVLLSLAQLLETLGRMDLVLGSLQPGDVHLSECCEVGVSGLARMMRSGERLAERQGRALTHYEAPELLLGGEVSLASDMWSFGMICLETGLGRTLGRPTSFLDALQFQFALCGSPSAELLRFLGAGPELLRVCETLCSHFQGTEELLPHLLDELEDVELQTLIQGLLQLDPRRRSTCAEVLNYPAFRAQLSAPLDNVQPSLLTALATRLRFEGEKAPVKEEDPLHLCSWSLEAFFVYLQRNHAKRVLKTKNFFVYLRLFLRSLGQGAA